MTKENISALKKFPILSIIGEVITFLLIFLFTYTASNKLFDYTSFRSQLNMLPLIGGSAGVLQILIPVSEIFISLLLIIKRFRITALYLSLTLLLVFTGYIFYMINSGYTLPCSCGGIISQLSWKQHVIFNSILIILNTTAIILKKTRSWRTALAGL